MVQSRLTQDVRMLRPYRPLYYDLGDETGIADLSAFWDFDFSEPSLRAMRVWLREIYGGLDALNREWGTQFQRWADVIPPTTAQTIARPDDNFSAWADFKEWMDIAFARALAGGTTAVHAADPHALAAIEGAQAPGWGGYDYAHLAHSVDLIELYDLGPNPNIEMLRSINPQLVMLTTSFGGGPLETYRTWRRLLRGTRGSILWDPENGFVGKDGNTRRPGPRSRSRFRRDPPWSRGIVDQQPATYRPDRSPLFAGEHAGAVDARPPRCEVECSARGPRCGARAAAIVTQLCPCGPAFGAGAAFPHRRGDHQWRAAPQQVARADAALRDRFVATRSKRDCGIYRARRRGLFRWRTGSVR